MWHKFEVAFALILLVGSLILWPISAVTWAKDEPQFVLGLSWFAITLTAMDLLKTSRVHKDADGDKLCDECGKQLGTA